MSGYEYYRRYSADELLGIAEGLRTDPANANPERGSIYLYKKSVHRKLGAIAYAITFHMADTRPSVIEGTSDTPEVSPGVSA